MHSTKKKVMRSCVFMMFEHWHKFPPDLVFRHKTRKATTTYPITAGDDYTKAGDTNGTDMCCPRIPHPYVQK